MIYKLISKDILPMAMIIVASRPIGTVSIRCDAQFTMRYEVDLLKIKFLTMWIVTIRKMIFWQEI